MTREQPIGHFEFRLLGPLEVEREGRRFAIGGTKQRTLLALLLLHANQVVPRERLIDALWGERPPRTALNSLQVAVHELRKLLYDERITTKGSGYVLRVEPDELDFDRFERLVERAAGQDPPAVAATLHEALALWRGPALADLRDVAFLRREADRLDDLRLAALEQRLDADLALGRHAELVPELQGLAGEHPYREGVRRRLMLALYRSGRQAEALAAYQHARHALVEELGIEPSAELQELERAILRQDVALELPVRRPRTNVPAPLTPLVGRQLEVAAVSALLRNADVRLLTLTGLGGTGKTRLALEAAARLLGDFSDGACFVDLAPLREADLVASQILRALEVAEDPARPVVDVVKTAVREKQLLLLLDNFEHLTDAAPLVTELLVAAPGVKALVTSRAVLQVSGEREYRVPPLRLPDLERDGVEAVARSEAVELFAARAAATSGFQLTSANARTVAAICVALDGLPLAIELAAARSRLLTVDAILKRLGSRLGLLTAGPRDAPARQRTLRDTIDWSFDLLDATEQRVIARFAVFAGGCTLESAEAVCEADVDQLSSLADKSLLRRTSDAGEPRFVMLETIRECAIERLQESGEGDRLRRRHAEHCRQCSVRMPTQRLIQKATLCSWSARSPRRCGPWQAPPDRTSPRRRAEGLLRPLRRRLDHRQALVCGSDVFRGLNDRAVHPVSDVVRELD